MSGGCTSDSRDQSPGPCTTGDAGTVPAAGPRGQASAVSVGDAWLLTDSYLCNHLPTHSERSAFGVGSCGREATSLFTGTRSRFSDPRGHSDMMDWLSLSPTLPGGSPPHGRSQATRL